MGTMDVLTGEYEYTLDSKSRFWCLPNSGYLGIQCILFVVLKTASMLVSSVFLLDIHQFFRRQMLSCTYLLKN